MNRLSDPESHQRRAAPPSNVAAAWVRYANVVHNYGIKYWEIGNETWQDSYMGANPGPLTLTLRVWSSGQLVTWKRPSASVLADLTHWRPASRLMRGRGRSSSRTPPMSWCTIWWSWPTWERKACGDGSIGWTMESSQSETDALHQRTDPGEPNF